MTAFGVNCPTGAQRTCLIRYASSRASVTVCYQEGIYSCWVTGLIRPRVAAWIRFQHAITYATGVFLAMAVAYTALEYGGEYAVYFYQLHR